MKRWFRRRLPSRPRMVDFVIDGCQADLFTGEYRAALEAWERVVMEILKGDQ